MKVPWSHNFFGTAIQIIMGCTAPAIAYLLIADPFGLMTNGYKSNNLDLNKPPAHIISPQEARKPINACGNIPTNGQILVKNFQTTTEGHKITIINGLSGDAIIKVRSAFTGKLVTSFYVKKNSTASVDNISDGSYKFQFAFGDAMNWDCKNFIDPVANEFNNIQSLHTEYTATQIITQEISFTLYDMTGGNARHIEISAEEFNSE